MLNDNSGIPASTSLSTQAIHDIGDLKTYISSVIGEENLINLLDPRRANAWDALSRILEIDIMPTLLQVKPIKLEKGDVVLYLNPILPQAAFDKARPCTDEELQYCDFSSTVLNVY